MSNKIQVKRGVVANLPTLSAGEPAFTTDTNNFYIGNGASNIEFAKKSDLDSVNTSLSDYTKVNSYLVDTGVANAYVITPSPVITSYVAGQVFKFKAVNANTGASTLNANGLGAKALVKGVSVALVTSEILVGQIITAIYDGTNFQIVPDYTALLNGNTSKVTASTKAINSNADVNNITQVVAHNLGVIPHKVIINACYYASKYICDGVQTFYPAANSCRTMAYGATNDGLFFVTNGVINFTDNVSNTVVATITAITSTTLTLTWTVTGTAKTGPIQFLIDCSII